MRIFDNKDFDKLLAQLSDASAWLSIAASRKDINVEELKESVAKVCMLSLIINTSFPNILPDKEMEKLSEDVVNDFIKQFNL